MNIKRFGKIALIVSFAALMTACSKVPPGYVGVKVELLGGDKGVDSYELGVGRYWIGVNEELYLFPTFMQNYTWTASSHEGKPADESLSFQTADGNVANADVGISYQFEANKVTSIFQTYRRGAEEITDTFLRNMVRDALVAESSNKSIEYVYGAGKAELIKNVQADVQAQVKDIGIKIDKIYWIGEIRLPKNIVDSINAKNSATQLAQQRENEIAQTTAEAKKVVVEAQGKADSILLTAQAQAKANKIISESLTPEFLKYKTIEKWTGNMPMAMLPNSSVPFVEIPFEKPNTSPLIKNMDSKVCEYNNNPPCDP